MKELWGVLLGLLGIIFGLVLADIETRDEVIHKRMAHLEARLQKKLLPTINIERATVYGGGGTIIIDDGKKEVELK